MFYVMGLHVEELEPSGAIESWTKIHENTITPSDITALKALKNSLEQVVAGKMPPTPKIALSWLTTVRVSFARFISLLAMQNWDEFSGVRSYPICMSPKQGSPYEMEQQAQAEYYSARRYGTLYDTNTEYGKARIRLAKHIITQVDLTLELLK